MVFRAVVLGAFAVVVGACIASEGEPLSDDAAGGAGASGTSASGTGGSHSGSAGSHAAGASGKAMVAGSAGQAGTKAMAGSGGSSGVGGVSGGAGSGGVTPFGGGGLGGAAGEPFGAGGAAGGVDCSDPFYEFEDCDDGNPCTVGEYCFDGACAFGIPKSCASLDPCKTSVCNPMSGACDEQPKPEGASCEADACTVNGTCKAGKCEGGKPKDCSFLTSGCNVGICDLAKNGCTTKSAPDGTACDDEDKCTFGDVCAAGVCKGMKVAAYTVFSDNFSSELPTNWTLGPGWEIGVGKAGSCDFQGGNDLAEDATPTTTDNRYAGTVIGGCTDGKASETSYLESPAFDATQNATSPLFLVYAHNNSFDSASNAYGSVEVFDGTTWVEVWKSKGGADMAWLTEIIDISKHRNAQMRIRFGFTQTKTTNLAFSGWAIDDVLVGAPACIP